MTEHRTYVFDLYGTLVDFTSLAERFRSEARDADAFVRDWRAKQLSYAFAATTMNRYEDFDSLTAAAYRYVARLHAMPDDPASVTAALEAWSALPAFPDALAALRETRARGFRTAILSNGTPAALAATVAACGFSEALDTVLSVDPVRKFKPHPEVYALVTKHFAIEPRDVIFVSSNGWDATGAAEFGFAVSWCNRSNLPHETFGTKPTRTIASLDALFAH
jgi:2-haloacid dehalogenase